MLENVLPASLLSVRQEDTSAKGIVPPNGNLIKSTKSEVPQKVFVYGTLKRGYGNNILLFNSTFLCNKTLEGFKLYYSYEDKGFPVAAPDKNSKIYGELFQLPLGDKEKETIYSLDRLEGNGIMYERTLVDDTWIYVGVPKFWNNFLDLQECPIINDAYVWTRK